MEANIRTTIAQHRQSDSAKLINLIRGDLDWIVMKALEKDRTRRYETANGFALDIQRHLDSEPVLARSPSIGYRTGKLIRKHKGAFAAVAAVLIALVSGLATSTMLYLRDKTAWASESAQRVKAEANERTARTEVTKSQQVAQFMKDMLGGVGPSVALGRDTMMLREILDKTAARVGTDLKDQPGVEAELRSTIGSVYQALGDYEKAEAMHRKALAIWQTLPGNEHLDVASSLFHLTYALLSQNKLAEAETSQRDALAIQRSLLGEEHPEVAYSLHQLAMVFWKQGKREEAEKVYRETLAMRTRLFSKEHVEVAQSMHALAIVLRWQGKLDEAESMQREALEMETKLLGKEHPDIPNSLQNLGNVLREKGRLPEAEAAYRDGLAMRQHLFGSGHPEIANSLNNLALILRDRGKLSDAEAAQREALAMHRKFLGDEHPDAMRSRENLISVLQEQGKLADIEALFREELAVVRKAGKDNPARLETLISDSAEILQREEKYAEAEPLYREALLSRRARLPAEDEELLRTTASLGRLLADWAWAEHISESKVQHRRPEIAERAHEAERLLRACLTTRLAGTEDSNRWRIADVRSRLGSALVAVVVADTNLATDARQAKLTEAEGLLLEGNDDLQKSKTGSKYKQDALIRLVHLYEAWDELAPNRGKAVQIGEWKKKLSEFDQSTEAKKATATKKDAAR